MENKSTFDKDVEQLVKFIKTIPFEHDVTSNEFGYNNSVLICMDAALSINRKYEAFVVPRIGLFAEKFPEITTLVQLKQLIDEKGVEGFFEVWNYKHEARVVLLYDLSSKFIDYAKKNAISNELDAMRKWANEVSPTDFVTFDVYGIGLATFQYLRMLLGASTFKPDVHISRAVEIALGEKREALISIELLEKAALKLGLDSTLVDHNIWSYFSEGGSS